MTQQRPLRLGANAARPTFDDLGPGTSKTGSPREVGGDAAGRGGTQPARKGAAA